MKKLTTSLLLLLLVISLIPAFIPIVTASPSAWYVSPTGNDSATGDITHPLQTLQKAINKSGSGDTIYLRDGVHNAVSSSTRGILINRSGTSSNWYTISGYPGETAIIDGSGYTLLPSFAILRIGTDSTGQDYVRISHLTIRNSNKDLVIASQYGGDTCSHIRIDNCTIDNASTHGLAVWGFNPNIAWENNVTVDNCIINNTQTSLSTGEGVTISGCKDVSFHDNILTNCPKIMLDFANGTKNVYCYQNTFVTSTGTGIKLDGSQSLVTPAYCSNINIYRNSFTGTFFAIKLAVEKTGGIDNVTVSNNVISVYNYTTNSAHGIKIESPLGYNHTFDNITIMYNTINIWHGNGSALLIEAFKTQMNNIYVANNIFQSNDTSNWQVRSSIANSTDSCFHFYNNIYNHTTQPAATWWFDGKYKFEASAIKASPQFMNRITGDFHLNDTSPAIDAADSNYTVTNDYDGRPRPQNGIYDIGAHEHHPLGNRLYVGGSGPGNYTNIQSAINEAYTNDTIFVYNGSYEEQINVTKSVLLKGQNNSNTIVVGGFNVIEDNTTIQNFNITGGYEWDPDGEGLNGNNHVGIYVHSSNNNFSHNNINHITGGEGGWNENQTGKSGFAIGIYLNYSVHNKITSNIFSSITGGQGISPTTFRGGDGGGSIGIYLLHSNDNNMTFNAAYRIIGGDGGDNNGDGGLGMGIYLDTSDNCNMSSNQIFSIKGGIAAGSAFETHGAGGDGYGLYLASSSSNKMISNTLNDVMGGKGGYAHNVGYFGAGIGIKLVSSTYNTIKLNTIENMKGSDSQPTGYMVGQGGHGNGILFESSIMNNVNQNTIKNISGGHCSGDAIGVSLHNSNHTNITSNSIDNIISGDGDFGGVFGYSTPGGLCAGIYLSSSLCNISKNIIKNITSGNGGGEMGDINGASGGTAAGIYLTSSLINVISNNTVNKIYAGNGGFGNGAGAFGVGIYLQFSYNSNITRNTIDDISGGDGGYPAGDGYFGAGIYLDTSNNCNVSFNQISSIEGGEGPLNEGMGDHTGNGGDGYGLYLNSSYSNNIFSNIFSDIIGGLTGQSRGWGRSGAGIGIKLVLSAYSTINLNTIENMSGGEGRDTGYAPGLGGFGGGILLETSNLSTINQNIITNILGGFSSGDAAGLFINNCSFSNINLNFIDKVVGGNGKGNGMFGSTPGGLSVGIYLSSTSSHVSNNSIKNVTGGTGANATWDVGTAGGMAVGIYFSISSTNLISDNTINYVTAGNGGNGYPSGSGRGGVCTGIYLQQSDISNITRNTVFGISGGNGGDEHGDGNFGIGICLNDSNNCNITFNQISSINGGNGTWSSGGGDGGDAGDGYGLYLNSSASNNIISNIFSYVIGGSAGAGHFWGYHGAGIGIKLVFSGYNTINLNTIENMRGSDSHDSGYSPGLGGFGGGILLESSTVNSINQNTINNIFGGHSAGEAIGLFLSDSNLSNITLNIIEKVISGDGEIGGVWGSSPGGLSAGIYLFSSLSHVSNNSIKNITGGNGGPAGGGNNVGGSGGMAVGIYLASSSTHVIIHNRVNKVIAGNGGNGYEGEPPEGGGDGGSGGSGAGIFLDSYNNEDILFNFLSNVTYGHGGLGGPTGDDGTDGIGAGLYGLNSVSNTISSCVFKYSQYGIYFNSSSNNLCYNNYLSNNINNAYDEGSNKWNITKTPGTNIIGGSYLGGNYWSDYPGTDSNSDGLGDTPYPINGSSQYDFYPLVNPPVEVLDQQQIQYNSNYAVYLARWGGQSFTPTMTSLTRVQLFMRKTGTPSDVVLSVRSSITGADLVSLSKPASQIPTSTSWVTFDLNDLTVTPGVTYYLVLRTTGGSSTNCYYWGYGSGTPYTNGALWYSYNGGSTWKSSTYDFCFKTYGMSAPSIPILSFNPVSFNFGNVVQSATGSTSFEIWNSGTGTLTYSLSESTSWASVTPTSGSSTSEHDTITVNIDTTSLTPASYNCPVNINSNGGSGTFTVYVTVIAPPTEVLDQQQTQYNTNYAVYLARLGGQSFIPTMSTLTSIQLYMRKTGSPPGDVILSVRSSLTGVDLVSLSKPTSQILTSMSWVPFDLNDLTVTPGNTYYLVLRTTGGSSTNCYYWGYGSNTPYTNGALWTSYNTGSTWTQYTQYDFCFKTYGAAAPSTPALSFNPGSYNFGNIAQGATGSTTFEIWNGGTGTLTYTLSESSNWVSVMPTSGSSSGEHDTITVNVNTTGLSPGSYNCPISINSNGGSGTFTVYITVIAPPTEVLDQQQTQYNTNYAVYLARLGGQSFIPTLGSLTSVQLYMRKTGSPPGDVVLSVRSSLTGVDLVSLSKPASQILTSIGWVTFDFNDLSVTPGNTYYLVLRTTGGDSTNCYYWGYGSNTPYSNGALSTSYNSGSSWTQYMQYDLCFKTYRFS